MLNKEIYDLMEAAAAWILLWLLLFVLYNLYRIRRHVVSGRAPAGHSLLFVEGAGLPLALMHSVSFGHSLLHRDWLSALLFAWWGPGFIAIAVFYLRWQKSGRPINWHPLRHLIAWMCKLNYLAFLLIYLTYGYWQIVFVFSVCPDLVLPDEYSASHDLHIFALRS